MSVSTQVQESLDDAVRCLREGLAFAARTESAITVQAISEQITRIENLSKLDELIAKFEGEITNNKLIWYPLGVVSRPQFLLVNVSLLEGGTDERRGLINPFFCVYYFHQN